LRKSHYNNTNKGLESNTLMFWISILVSCEDIDGKKQKTNMYVWERQYV